MSFNGNLWLERLDLGPKRLDLRPKRLDLRPERLDLRPKSRGGTIRRGLYLESKIFSPPYQPGSQNP